MNYLRRKITDGFTLLEILMAIAIIMALVFVSVNYTEIVKLKARDTDRKNDMVQLQEALALYYESFRVYPNSYDCETMNINKEFFGAKTICYNNILNQELTKRDNPYFYYLPADPNNPANDSAVSEVYLYRYATDDSAKDYVITYYLESEKRWETISKDNIRQ